MGGHLSTPTQPPTANSERRKSSGANACCWEGHLSSWQASRWGTQEVPPNNIRRSVHHQSASDLPPGPSGALLELSGQDHTFFLIYLFGRCWYAMTALSTPAATSHMLLFKIIKIKNFLKCSSYSYRPHSSALEPFIRQCTQGTPPSVQKPQNSNVVHFSLKTLSRKRPYWIAPILDHKGWYYFKDQYHPLWCGIFSKYPL